MLSISTLKVAVADSHEILVVGDSLSAGYGIQVDRGWVALLRARLRALGYPQLVANASISGDTTRGGLDRLPAALAAYKPCLVIIELGANDGLRGLSLQRMAANLTAMVKAVQAQGGKAVLVQMRIPPNYGPAYTEKFKAVYAKVAQDTGAVLAPFLLDGVAGNPALTQDDGLHPVAAGQPRMLDNIWPTLAALLTKP